MGLIDAHRLEIAANSLGEVAADPAAWPRTLELICAAAHARGAALLQSDDRTPDIPRTPSFEEVLQNYFAGGWHIRDIRARGAVPLLNGALVVTDRDVVTPEEMRLSPYYNEAVYPFGFKWFAGIGFRAGGAHWVLTLQRTPVEGPFEPGEIAALEHLSGRLGEAATLSAITGGHNLTGAMHALAAVRHPALVLGRHGVVLQTNNLAEAIFDDNVRVHCRHLVFVDQRAQASLRQLCDRLDAASDYDVIAMGPFLAERPGNTPVLVRICSIPAAARTPFLGARALLVLTVIEGKRGPSSNTLSRAFRLSRAEARLASLIAEGMNPKQVAAELGISRETARNQLKAVFQKTATHRQGELIALLAKLSH